MQILRCCRVKDRIRSSILIPTAARKVEVVSWPLMTGEYVSPPLTKCPLIPFHPSHDTDGHTRQSGWNVSLSYEPAGLQTTLMISSNMQRPRVLSQPHSPFRFSPTLEAPLRYHHPGFPSPLVPR